MRFSRQVPGDRDRGATLVEFSLIFGFLVMIALGTFEYGMLFRDWTSVNVSTREGARVAASAADHGAADCVILEAATGALQGLTTGEVDEVHIYRSSDTGSYPGPNSSYNRRYSPFNPGDPNLVVCNGSNWNAEWLGSNWDPDDRVDSVGSADWIGVRVEFSHEYMTNFLWWNGSANFTDDAVFRIEPPAPN